MHANNQPTQDTIDPHQKADFRTALRRLMLEDIAEINTIKAWRADHGWTCPFAIEYALHRRLKELGERCGDWIRQLGGLDAPW